MSRAEQLPVELVLDILLSAAEISIFEDRPWVVQLALVSRDVYNLVHPVLYRTMIVTLQNINRLLLLASDERFLHVFQAVRRLAVHEDVLIDFGDDLISGVMPRKSCFSPRLFTSTVDLCAPFYAVEELLQFPDCRPRRIIMSTSSLTYVLHGTRLGNVTHIVGYFPVRLNLPPTQWALDFLSALPVVTHITFRLPSNLGGWHGSLRPIDLSTFEELFRTLLESRRIARLALHVGRSRLKELPFFKEFERRLHDARFGVCIDTRPMPLGRHADCLDIRAGMDIWDSPCSVLD